MTSVSPKNSSTALHAAPSQSTDNATANVATKASLPQLCEKSCWRQSLQSMLLNNKQKVDFTVLTYNYSISERIVNIAIFCLGIFLIVPLLSSNFRALLAPTKELFICDGATAALKIRLDFFETRWHNCEDPQQKDYLNYLINELRQKL